MRPAFNEKRSFRPSFSFVSTRDIRRGTEFPRTYRAMARVYANYRATIYFHENLVSFLHSGRVERPTVALEELIIKSKQGEVLEKT